MLLGWGTEFAMNGKTITGTDLFICAIVGLAVIARGLYKKMISAVTLGALTLAMAYLLAALQAIQ